MQLFTIPRSTPGTFLLLSHNAARFNPSFNRKSRKWSTGWQRSVLMLCWM